MTMMRTHDSDIEILGRNSFVSITVEIFNERDGLCISTETIQNKKCFPLSGIVDLRRQSSVMRVIMLGEKTHTRGLQRKEETTYQPISK